MKKSLRKLLLIITIILAIATIVFKTILNSDYYKIVKAINKNYEIQNPVDYKDDEIIEQDKNDNTNNNEVIQEENEMINNEEVNHNEDIENNETTVEDNNEKIPERPIIDVEE